MFNLHLPSAAVARSLQRVTWLALAMFVALASLTMLVLVIVPAHAEGVAGTTASGLFTGAPWLDAILAYVQPAIVTVIGLLVMWALQRLASLLGLKIDDAQRAVMDKVLQNAISYAVEYLKLRSSGRADPDARAAVVAHAKAYAETAIPDALKHFGVTPDRLGSMIEARIEDALAPKAVVVPDATASAAKN